MKKIIAALCLMAAALALISTVAPAQQPATVTLEIALSQADYDALVEALPSLQIAGLATGPDGKQHATGIPQFASPESYIASSIASALQRLQTFRNKAPAPGEPVFMKPLPKVAVKKK